MNPDDSAVELIWNARSVRPVVSLYVAGVFFGFMALAHFVVHSAEAVKALLLTGIGSVAALMANTLIRIEYRFTEVGLAKGPFKAKEPKALKQVFLWDELSHLIPTSTGFKFYKRVTATHGMARFLKLHVFGSHSGEFHVEREDLGKVRAVIERHGVPLSKPPSGGRVEAESRV